jgi:type II restriction enzyme
MNIVEAKKAIDKVIAKARVHFYKPIQIAEILYRDRTEKGILLELDNLGSP